MAPARSRRAPAISTAAPAFSSRPGPGGAAAAYACGERGWERAGTSAPGPGRTRPDLTRFVPVRPVTSRPVPTPPVPYRPKPPHPKPPRPVRSRAAWSRSIPTHAHRLCPDPTLSRPVPAGSTHGGQAQLHIVGPRPGDGHLLGALCHGCRGTETCLSSAPAPAPAGLHRPGPPRSRTRPAGRAAPPSPGHNEPLELPGSRRGSPGLCPPAPSPSPPTTPGSRLHLPSRGSGCRGHGGRECRGHSSPARRGGEEGCPVRQTAGI